LRTKREPDAWGVGVLFSQTGCTSVIERTQLQGTLLAIEEINAGGGVRGREIVPVIYDPGSEPVMFNRLADRLLTEDQVATIFGCYTSSSRKAVLPVIERRNGLLWYPTLYEGFEYSPNVIYTGAAPNQDSVQLAEYLLRHFGKRFYLIGSDYIYPRESNRIMKDLVEGAGGSIVAERYLDIRAEPAAYAKVVAEIKQKQPDVIFSTVVGVGTAYLYQAHAEAGLSARTMPIASLTTSEAEVALMGHDVAEGHVTAAPYFETVNTPVNSAFVARYRKRFSEGELPNMCVEAAYFQVFLFAQALAISGSMDTDKLRPAVLGMEFDAPQGRVVVDPENNHTSLWPRIGKLNDCGKFDIVREALEPVRPDPYLVNYHEYAGLRNLP
jgi:branched-chain amino acid transport system substrate-binding protein